MDKIYKKEDNIYIRVDKDRDLRGYLLELGLSKKYFNYLYKNKRIEINNKDNYTITKLRNGDLIKIKLEEEILPRYGRDKIELVYEDDYLLIIDKTKRKIAHECRFNIGNTIENDLASYFNKKGIIQKPRLINRLDKETKGLILVGKDRFSSHILYSMFSNKMVERRYLGLVEGRLEGEGVIKKPLKKLEGESRVIVDNDGKMAISKWKTIKVFSKFSLVDIELITGRTHQIRCHLASIGYPLLGDEKYGSSIKGGNYFLSAYKLSFSHPFLGVKIEAKSPSTEKYLYKIKNS